MEKTILNQKRILFVLLLFSNLLFSGNEFVKSKIRGGELKLYFSSSLDKVSYFKLPQKDGSTKFVYDIHNAVLPRNKGISKHTFRTIKSFRMAQNSSSKLRVVIQSKQKDLTQHVFKGKVLAIPLIDGKQSTFAKSVARVNLKHHYIVVIDAGHGGKDNGASCCHKRNEKTVVLSVAQKLKKQLKNKGYKVYMTRDKDTFVKLPKRTEFANSKRADIFVSIHANAAPTKEVFNSNAFRGIEIYYLSPAKTQRAKEAAAQENSVLFKDKDQYTQNAYLSLISREKIIESHKLGLDVNGKMLSNVHRSYASVRNGGVKPANFWVLVGAQMPAILVETGYLTHSEDGKNLMNNNYRDLLAKGIAEGIGQYLRNSGK